MKCPKCLKGVTQVTGTRRYGNRVRRYRRCPECGHKFCTTELPADDLINMEYKIRQARRFGVVR